MRVTVGDLGLCCCATYFERRLTPLCVDSSVFTGGGGGGGGGQTNVRNKFEVGDKTKYTPSGESIHRKPK